MSDLQECIPFWAPRNKKLWIPLREASRVSDTRNTVYILTQHTLDYAMDLLGQSTYLAKLALIPFNEPFVYICKKYALRLVYPRR